MTICTIVFIILFAVLNGYIVLVDLSTKVLPNGRWIFVYPNTPLTNLRQFLIGQIPLIIIIPSNAIIIFKIRNQRQKWKKLKTSNQKNREERK